MVGLTVNPQKRLAGLISSPDLQLRVSLEFGCFYLLFSRIIAGLDTIRVPLEGEPLSRINGICQLYPQRTINRSNFFFYSTLVSISMKYLLKPILAKFQLRFCYEIQAILDYLYL